MDETGKKLLRLMFREDETICVSTSQFGYHSIPLNKAMDGEVTLVPTQESAEKRKLSWTDSFEKVHSSQLLMCALNPIKGFRTDANCTAYRNFLVEIDIGPIEGQIQYVKRIGLPYSAMVFSGNKSIHTLVSLSQDLVDEKTFRHTAQWILNICTIADQQTKNPSRSIRIPGAYREPGKQQALVDFKGQVNPEDLFNWLRIHPEAEPKERERKPISDKLDIDRLPNWVADRLVNGLDPTKGRNGQWFAMAIEFALASYEEDDTISILSEFFSPDADFKEKEWLTSIHSGFTYVEDGKANE